MREDRQLYEKELAEECARQGEELKWREEELLEELARKDEKLRGEHHCQEEETLWHDEAIYETSDRSAERTHIEEIQRPGDPAEL